MVNNDNFVFLVSVLIKLRNYLVLFESGARETECFPDVKIFVLLHISQIDEQKISFNADWKLFCFDCYGGEVRCLTPSIILCVVNVVDGFGLSLLIQHLPES